ncbi:MBL fold metallo-hydrolase [Deinococcus sp.]|uniref:MBL fold metallo-hydrolase n=1 Tax=Deinococcus sp. TaxID=47478 RepID=UPI003C7A1716
MSAAPVIRSRSLELMPGVQLNVHAVCGPQGSVLIDTGIASMRPQVLDLCAEAQRVAPLRFVLLTHIHADHIGCNRAVWEATAVPFAAAGAIPWAEDLERHYREFCVTDALPDSPGQRREIMSLMDGPVPIQLLLVEGNRFFLGGGVELETIAFPGHKLEEVGFLEARTGTLILGDVLLALAAPFFHGFQTATGFAASLTRLEDLLASGRVQQVRTSHHPPMSPEGALQAAQQTRQALEEVRVATLEAARGVTFEALWREVSRRLGRQAEFRGYATLRAQVGELVGAGELRRDGPLILRS